MYKMFLDDERFPIGEDWIIVRTFDEAVQTVSKHGLPSFISFDHDLGEDKTGYDFAKWLAEFILDNDLKMFEYCVHSQNPVGKDNIEKYLENFKTIVS